MALDDVGYVLGRFQELAMLLDKLLAAQKLVVGQPNEAELHVLLAQVGLLAIDLTQTGVAPELIPEVHWPLTSLVEQRQDTPASD